MYGIIKDIVKAAFHFEMNKSANIDKLVCDPFMYDYFIEENIDFKQDLVDILIKTNFKKNKLKELISRLDFSKILIFDYKNGKITHEG